MAGDWIKMRTDLYRHPKVCLIADRLLAEHGKLARYVSQNCQRDMAVTRNVMRNVTVGALVTVWGVTRHRGERKDDDLILKNTSLSVVDDVADLPGIGDALASVGWVEQIGDDLIFPRFFEELNVEPGADYKKSNAERQRRYREKRNANSNVTDNVTVAPQSNAREEKEKEKSNKKTPAPFDLDSHKAEVPESIKPTWMNWLAYKIERKEVYKPTGLKAAESRVSELCTIHGERAVVTAIQKAMANNWQGFDHDNTFGPSVPAKTQQPKPAKNYLVSSQRNA